MGDSVLALSPGPRETVVHIFVTSHLYYEICYFVEFGKPLKSATGSTNLWKTKYKNIFFSRNTSKYKKKNCIPKTYILKKRSFSSLTYQTLWLWHDKMQKNIQGKSLWAFYTYSWHLFRECLWSLITQRYTTTEFGCCLK